MAGFRIGDRVEVPSQGYSGTVIAVRENGDVLVRYSIEGARKPFYETWWPTSYVLPGGDGHAAD